MDPHRAASPVIRARVDLSGVVQGVGFRPFVARLAGRLALSGWVRNAPAGVEIEVEGPADRCRDFIETLQRDAPGHARIEECRYRWGSPLGERGFTIRESAAGGRATGLVLPDIAPCDACVRELFDPSDRRCRYPFTSCAECGPRFSILLAHPYDRANTTMAGFTLCADCRSEYECATDRRFHAQAIACARCGPELRLEDHAGATLARGADALSGAAGLLGSGAIVAVKGLGGFQLLVDARDEAAVRRLRCRKHREAKPFGVMAPSPGWIRRWCAASEIEERLLTSPAAPIVLLERRGGAAVVPGVAPDNPLLGVMLPTTPLHHLLLAETGFAVVATSGNRVDEPLCTDNAEARERLAGIADYFLLHNRPIARPLDDSVVRVIAGEAVVLRRARGFVPGPVGIGVPLREVAAFGAHQKNTIAVTCGANVLLSQHLGDLDSERAVLGAERAAGQLAALCGAHPRAAVCDQHPEYASTVLAEGFASSRGVPVLRIQHHHAHVLACAAEHGLRGPVLGVCWDGTGLGPDGTIWGGEFLLVDGRQWRRVAHLRRFPLAGGDSAAREPRRSALGLLYAAHGEAAFGGSAATLRGFAPQELGVLRRMLTRGVRAPLTSSAGRLFDGIASLLDLRQRTSFEGEAAMALEFQSMRARSAGTPGRPYPWVLREGDGDRVWEVDWKPMVCEVAAVGVAGRDIPEACLRVHHTLAEVIAAIAGRAGERRVVLTGGCFQNALLTEMALESLGHAGFHCFRHRQVPPNDGGIALGQAVAAGLIWEGGQPCASRSPVE
jgi:hydrogenase maturation protein HypF